MDTSDIEIGMQGAADARARRERNGRIIDQLCEGLEQDVRTLQRDCESLRERITTVIQPQIDSMRRQTELIEALTVEAEVIPARLWIRVDPKDSVHIPLDQELLDKADPPCRHCDHPRSSHGQHGCMALVRPVADDTSNPTCACTVVDFGEIPLEVDPDGPPEPRNWAERADAIDQVVEQANAKTPDLSPVGIVVDTGGDDTSTTATILPTYTPQDRIAGLEAVNEELREDVRLLKAVVRAIRKIQTVAAIQSGDYDGVMDALEAWETRDGLKRINPGAPARRLLNLSSAARTLMALTGRPKGDPEIQALYDAVTEFDGQKPEDHLGAKIGRTVAGAVIDAMGPTRHGPTRHERDQSLREMLDDPKSNEYITANGVRWVRLLGHDSSGAQDVMITSESPGEIRTGVATARHDIQAGRSVVLMPTGYNIAHDLLELLVFGHEGGKMTGTAWERIEAGMTVDMSVDSQGHCWFYPTRSR